MTKNFKAVTTLAVAICSIVVQLACHAQSTAPNSGQSGSSSSANSAPQAGSAVKLLASASAEQPADPRSAADTTTTTAPDSSVSVTTPPIEDAVMKEISEMKARIALLETELKAQHGASDAARAEQDANAMRKAVAGESSSTIAYTQAPEPPVSAAAPATAPAPAAAPAPPEISAERPTKEAPFPGDWTWLNSNGHAVDSPMATKYFTPEFRADANYTLDYNHPEDDTLGGSTETFRSDEWQLEQISFGGDIRIDNVRGRILTMDGLFATTTPRNDASPNRGQWDLADAYKYVSEAMGRLSLGCGSRPECGCGHLRLLYRPVQLLQLRQLDLSAFVCLLQHALVLQRPPYPIVSRRRS